MLQIQKASNCRYFGGLDLVLLQVIEIMELSVGAWVGIAAVVLFVLLGISHYWLNSKYINVAKKTYLVTGGSSGIGKAVAKVRPADAAPIPRQIFHRV